MCRAVYLCPDGVLLGSKVNVLKVNVLLRLLQRLKSLLVLGESSSNGSGLLASQLGGKVLLSLVLLRQLGSLGVVEDRQHSCDRLADVVAIVSSVSLPCTVCFLSVSHLIMICKKLQKFMGDKWLQFVCWRTSAG